MKKTMKMIVSLVLAVMFLALLGCRNETVTPKPEPTQDANASQKPTETEKPTEAPQPTQTEQLAQAAKPEQPYLAPLKYIPYDEIYTYNFSVEEKEACLPVLDEHDLNAVRTFLEIKDENGVRNGEKMNEWYSPDDPTTWFYTPVDNEHKFMKEGYRGYVNLLSWGNEGDLWDIYIEPFIQKCDSSVIGFVGELDLSNCKSLSGATISGNNIKAISFEGCESLSEAYIPNAKSLETLNATGTDMYKFHIVDAMNLKTVISSTIKSTYFFSIGSGLKQIDWVCNYADKSTGKNYFHIKVNTEGAGSVETHCGDDADYYLSISALPGDGHRFIGWYDAEGKLVSTDKLIDIIGENNFLELGADAQFEFTAKFE